MEMSTLTTPKGSGVVHHRKLNDLRDTDEIDEELIYVHRERYGFMEVEIARRKGEASGMGAGIDARVVMGFIVCIVVLLWVFNNVFARNYQKDGIA